MRQLFSHDATFVKSLKVTTYYVIVAVPVIQVAALLMALAMNLRVRGITIFRTLCFLPSVISGVDQSFEVLGPVPLEQPGEDQVRALVRAPRAQGGALAKALQAAQAGRSARKEGGGARVQLDPPELI